ncbi:MAG: DoxX family membrane protein [Phycisphaeraceae bacterium]|nr:DoxX family membrane protein [Phycisphaeraceae bacterium]
MKNSESNLISLALLFNRVALGLLFVLAGVRKILPSDEATIIDKMNGFASFVASKAPLPDFLGKAYGYALPWAEITCGALLLIGLLARVSSVLIGLMILSFIIAMGADWWPESGPAFSKNFILMTLCILIAAAGSGKFAVKPGGPMK